MIPSASPFHKARQLQGDCHAAPTSFILCIKESNP